jgi:hypothetical protein
MDNQNQSGVTLDFSKSQPVQAEQPVTLDFSKAESLPTSNAADSATKSIPKPSVDMEESPLGYLASGEPDPNAEKKASDSRQSAVAGLTGMATPNMNPAQKAEFERGKNAGAISNVATVGAVAGAESVPAVIEALAPHLPELDKVVRIAKALGYGSLGVKELTDIFKALHNK